MTVTLLSDALTKFEAEVLELLREEGPVEFVEGGERSVPELFGYPNSCASELWRALRLLAVKGLVGAEDGKGNKMLGYKHMPKFTHGATCTFYALS